HEKTAEALRAAGVRTVHDAARMDPAAFAGVAHASAASLERIRLQAQALVDEKLRWLAKPELPSAPIAVYFDIEGDPLLGVEYLFGFRIEGDPEGRFAAGDLVRRDGDAYYVAFLAERPEDEERMWRAFV